MKLSSFLILLYPVYVCSSDIDTLIQEVALFQALSHKEKVLPEGNKQEKSITYLYYKLVGKYAKERKGCLDKQYEWNIRQLQGLMNSIK